MTRIPTSTTQTKRLALLHGPDRWWKPPLVHAMSYPGRFDVPRLQTALRLLARRHSGLRTHFLPDGSIDEAGCLPAQEASWPFTFVEADPDETKAEAQEAEAYSWLQADFDPYERPLVRALLLRRAQDDVLGLSVEHSLFDGHSARILIDDLSTVYEGLESRPESAFDVLASDAVAFARDERRWLDGDEGGAALAWWDEHNAGLGPYPRLQIPETGPFDPDETTIYYSVPLAEDEVASLQARRLGLRLSPFMLAAAAVTVTLREYAPTDDVAFLFSNSRRSWPSTKELVAYCANRSLLRLDAARTDSVASVARKVRTASMKAIHHSMYSHEEYMRTRFPDSWERQPHTPYLLLNVMEQRTVPTIAGLPSPRVSLPTRPGVYNPPGIGLNLAIHRDGTGVLLSFHPQGMYDRSFIEELTRTVARRCVTGE
ncbi:condensation domain-containing protein [Streptomyces sp. NBC_01102]|uniref:condensation domain-containing protein n=1 Tax=unclassified Streptomyces TaxID=2593676 RepID=UPI003865971D|nr:condensation domain-containing protein [Streptomyces sp. NBC_01102]